MADKDTATFGKAPRRKTPQGKRVTVSKDVREQYEAEMRRRDEHEKKYGQHLAPEDKGKR